MEAWHLTFNWLAIARLGFLLLLIFSVGLEIFAQNPCKQVCWVNVATGKRADTVPASAANYGGNAEQFGVVQINRQNGTATNPQTNQGFVKNSDGSWVDVQTGKCADTVPASASNYGGNAEQFGVVQINRQNGTATNPVTNEAFVRVPCSTATSNPPPPPTPTPTPTPEPNPKILWFDPFDLTFGYAYNRMPDEVVKNSNGFGVNAYINLKTTYVEHGSSHHANASNSATRRVPKWSIGIDGDFTAAFGSTTVGTTKSTLHRFLFLGGPQFQFYPSRKTKLFIHPLFGGVHDSGTTTVGTISTTASASAFAMAFGGGLDIAVSPRIGVRPFQFDYVPTHFGNAWQNNFRLAAGIVVRAKKKH